MANYLCLKCGCTAYSKCISQRSTFIEQDMVTMVNNSMIQAQNELHWKDYAREINRLSKSYPDAFIMATCQHDWEMQSEQCDLGCCQKHRVA